MDLGQGGAGGGKTSRKGTDRPRREMARLWTSDGERLGSRIRGSVRAGRHLEGRGACAQRPGNIEWLESH